MSKDKTKKQVKQGESECDLSMEALIEHARKVAEAKGVRIAVQVLCGDK